MFFFAKCKKNTIWFCNAFKWWLLVDKHVPNILTTVSRTTIFVSLIGMQTTKLNRFLFWRSIIVRVTVVNVTHAHNSVWIRPVYRLYNGSILLLSLIYDFIFRFLLHYKSEYVCFVGYSNVYIRKQVNCRIHIYKQQLYGV